MKAEIVSESVRVTDRAHVAEYRVALAADVRAGMCAARKELPPKYFYDERGSLLFEQICDLQEYYQTRTEAGILAAFADEIAGLSGASTLVEFGSGSSTKTRLLLTALERAGTLRTYVPIDISREILVQTAEDLVREYPALQVEAVIADFNDGIPPLDSEGPALAAFLGSTIGNFHHQDAVRFLSTVAAGMRRQDMFLLGVDLVKEPSILNPAYNDARGITAEFNLNVLRVINRELGANFNVAGFEHYAFFNPIESQIEMHVASLREQEVVIEAIGERIAFERGETIRTEISRKFTRGSTEEMLRAAGMQVVEFRTDPAGLFGVCLARRAG